MEAKDTVIHADGCSTNLGIIGAVCNCGAEGQAEITWDIAFKAGMMKDIPTTLDNLRENIAQELSRGRKHNWSIGDYREQADRILTLIKEAGYYLLASKAPLLTSSDVEVKFAQNDADNKFYTGG